MIIAGIFWKSGFVKVRSLSSNPFTAMVSSSFTLMIQTVKKIHMVVCMLPKNTAIHAGSRSHGQLTQLQPRRRSQLNKLGVASRIFSCNNFLKIVLESCFPQSMYLRCNRVFGTRFRWEEEFLMLRCERTGH